MLKTKIDVFRSLVLSKYTFQVHTWSWVKASTITSWNNGIHPMLFVMARHLCSGTNPATMDVYTLCGLIQLPTPHDCMAKQRLLYIARMLTHGPSVLWAFVFDVSAADGWCAQVTEDLDWLCRFCPLKLPDICTKNVRQWIQHISNDPKWSTLVKSAAKACVRYRKRQADAKLRELRIATKLQNHGVICQKAQRKHECLQCMICGENFGSRRALGMHSHLVHGYIPEVKFFADGSTCFACGKEFHDRPRFICHLKGNDRCLQIYKSCFPPLPNRVVQTLDAEDLEFAHKRKLQGWSRMKALKPAFRLTMPCLPPANSEDADVMMSKWRARHPDPGDAFQHLGGIYLHNDNNDSCPDDSVPAFVFQSPAGRNAGHNGVFNYDGVSVLDARMWITDLIFVHFFSGHRRSKDLQFTVESTTMFGTTKIWCLSVDLCLQGPQGDLLESRQQQEWFEAVKSHRVIGGGGGSPCETFSAARFYDGGPPPIRSATELHGLPNLTSKQSKQVAIGNGLLHFLMEFLLWTALCGGCGFSEHPQYPVWLKGKAPSIWAMKVTRWLKSLTCSAVVSFDQCCVGGVAKKPTTLLLIRMTETRNYLLSRGCSGRCPHGPLAHAPLIGKSGSEFHTAKTKVYPFGLNQAISFGIHHFVKCLMDPTAANTVAVDLPGWAEDYHPAVDDMYRDVIQPDYYG